MKLSVVILCWNDLKVISDCLRSIFDGNNIDGLEVIVSDNGSTDGSIEYIKKNYPAVRVLENNANLGFAKGNNVGIAASTGEYVLILNPDTIIHQDTFKKWLAVADQRPEAGAFGCRVLNPDGSYQISARPVPTPARFWISALYLRRMAYLSDLFTSDTYAGWEGDTERYVDWQSGCCVMFRGPLLKKVGGFDEQFFYHFEEVDLCFRVRKAGFPILFTPVATITHLGGQSVSRFPIRFALETQRNRYRFFYKHYGPEGAWQCRRILLTYLRVRKFGYRLKSLGHKSESLEGRLATYRTCIDWNQRIDPVRFVEYGEEPRIQEATS